MKKTISIFLTIAYFFAAGGVLLNVHYCGGKVSGVNLAFANAKCVCGERPGKENCCKNEHKLLQVKDAHKGLAGINITKRVMQLAYSYYNAVFYNIIPSNASTPLNSIISSSYQGDLLYKRHCVYRI